MTVGNLSPEDGDVLRMLSHIQLTNIPQPGIAAQPLHGRLPNRIDPRPDAGREPRNGGRGMGKTFSRQYRSSRTKAGMIGAILSVGTFVTTVTIIPFMPDGWNAAAGFSAMQGNVAFLMKDVVLLAVSVYLLKQDVVRAASLPAVERRQGQEPAGARAWAAVESGTR
jgi:hypothetical protein